MESDADADDLDNIFDENDNNVENIEIAQNSTETSGGVKIAPPKRIVKNPRLKFNPERLCGERGIPILVDHFKDVKFKGAGHEKEDLDRLLSKLEHWTHRLFPSMKFDECLLQIEKLGKKRPVQTCLRKIRLDMPILNSDFVKDDDDENRRNDASEPEEIDAFDRLIGESQSVPHTSVDEIIPRASSSLPVSDKTSGRVLGTSFGSSLSDEQKERMERNKMLAAERRKARLAALKQSTESNSESSELVPSQDIVNAENSCNETLDSANNNSKTVEASNHDFDKIFNQNRTSADEPLLELNKNSENLGLDDLVDLIGEDEPATLDKTLATNVQNNCNQMIDSMHKDQENVIIKPNYDSSDDINEDTKGSAVESSSELKNINSENLGLDDLVDLVNVDEAPLGIASSQHLQSASCPSGKTSESMEDVINDDNFSNVKESNEAKVSDRLDDETTFCAKSPFDTEENMQVESLSDVIDGNSRDSQPNTSADCLVKDTLLHDSAGNSALDCKESTAMDCDGESTENV